LNITRQEAIGHLVNFWVWADQNTEDGRLIGDRKVVDTLTMENFANELIKVGWLDIIGGHIEIPKFLLHNGASAKRRALTAQRVANHRKRNSNNDGVTDKLLYNTILNNKDINSYSEDPNIEKVKELWNESNNPKIKAMTNKRKKAIKAILKDYHIDQITEVFKKIPLIPFLNGDNKYKWKCDFNWIMKPDNFIKLEEGGYDTQTNKENDFNKWGDE